MKDADKWIALAGIVTIVALICITHGVIGFAGSSSLAQGALPGIFASVTTGIGYFQISKINELKKHGKEIPFNLRISIIALGVLGLMGAFGLPSIAHAFHGAASSSLIPYYSAAIGSIGMPVGMYFLKKEERKALERKKIGEEEIEEEETENAKKGKTLDSLIKKLKKADNQERRKEILRKLAPYERRNIFRNGIYNRFIAAGINGLDLALACQAIAEEVKQEKINDKVALNIQKICADESFESLKTLNKIQRSDIIFSFSNILEIQKILKRKGKTTEEIRDFIGKLEKEIQRLNDEKIAPPRKKPTVKVKGEGEAEGTGGAAGEKAAGKGADASGEEAAGRAEAEGAGGVTEAKAAGKGADAGGEAEGKKE